MIIGISAKKQHGKDTVGGIAGMLLNGNQKSTILKCAKVGRFPQYDWRINKFADSLKDIVCILLGCTREQLEDNDFKNTKLGSEWWYYGSYQHGFNYDVLESIHSNKEDAEYILEYSRMNYVKLIKPTPRTFLQLLGTDCGRKILHPDIWVNSLMNQYSPETSKWIVTDVRFPNELQAIEDAGGITIRVERPSISTDDKHESETALDDAEFDYIIENSGSMEDLVDMVEQLLKDEGLI